MSWKDNQYKDSEGPDQFGQRPGKGELLRKVGEFFNRSYPIGTYLEIRVRVHLAFLIFVGLQLIFDGDPWHTLRWTALLFLSVLLHEFGHAFGCRSVGGKANDILIWPLGGLAFCDAPKRPWPEFVTVICGPLVNVVIGVACYVTLLLITDADQAMPVSLDPFVLWVGDSLPGWRGLIVDLFVVNYVLLLFNLLLVFYPFDGGRLVQIGLWKWLGYRKSMFIALRVGMIGAVGVAVFGLTNEELMLVLIGAYGFYICYQQNRQMKLIEAQGGGIVDLYRGGAGDSGGDGSDATTWGGEYDPGFYNSRGDDEETDQPKPSFFQRRQQKKQESKRAKAEQSKQKFESEVDRILIKVKAKGIDALTAGEKKKLQQATDQKQ
jgi:stage IV sporulation protein FB